MGALTNKLCSHFRNYTSIFFSVTLPHILRTAFLIANVLWISYKRERVRYKFASSINRQTSTFVHREKHANSRPGDDSVVTCSTCLSDVEDGEEVREVTTCKHAFHRKCIDEWLVHGGFCPLCRHVLMPKEMVDEHHRVVVRNEVGGGRNHEMELAVLFLSAVHGRNCHRFT